MRTFILIGLAWILAGVMWPTAVHAECLNSASAVRAEHPGSWPSWEGRSHPGHRCWYSTERKVRPLALQRTNKTLGTDKHATRPRPASLPAGAVNSLQTNEPENRADNKIISGDYRKQAQNMRAIMHEGVMPDNLFSLFSSQVTSDFDWNSAEWDRLFAARERAGMTFAAVGGR